ncbi:hypothetical protein DMENIID0001_153130 [Sergentomyia squamirostris]
MGDHREINRHQRNDSKEFLNEYSKKVFKWKDGESFVDIGCGPGDVTKDFIWPKLPSNYSRYLCLDLSEDQLDRCQRELMDKDRIFFAAIDLGLKQDLTHLDQFDHAISLMCLHWIPNQVIALENIFNLVAPGGDFFFSFVTECPNRKIISALMKSEKWKTYFPMKFRCCEPYWRSQDPTVIFTKFLREAGFTNIKIELREILYEWETPEQFYKYVNEFARRLLLKHIPEKHIEEFLWDQIDLATELNVIVSSRNRDKPIDLYKIIVGFAEKPVKV